MALLVLGLVVLATLALPLFLAPPGPLSSDESLYLSEGLNLAEGRGFTYTTGEPVHHRGPLFPALLAGDFALAGASFENGLWVPRLFALGNAALVLLLGWRCFGRESGLLSAALALASALLSLLGVSLFLDGAETFFLLLALACLHTALLRGRPLWAGLAGAALGLAMLTKESALLWLPMPFLAVLLLGPAVDRPRAQLLASSAGFAAVAGWWWPYVYAVTGQVYLLGSPEQAAPWLGLAALCLGLLALLPLGLAGRARPSGLGPRARRALVGGLLLGWGAFFLVGLEQHSGWPFPHDYWRTVPDYTARVLGSWLRPLPLVGLAWGYVAYRAARGSLSDRLLLLGLLLFLPFALFVAHRDLHVRDILPLIYLSYLALGRAAIDAARWIAEMVGEGLSPAVGATVGTILVLSGFSWFVVQEAQHVADYRSSFDPSRVQQSNWDNPLVHRVARWVEEQIPPGTPVMSSRLYYSHLYALTGGRYPWWQLPTVRVAFAGEPPAPARATTMFRWEDHLMPSGPAAPWLYLQRYPRKGYYVALSERDLLGDLREHRIGYLIVTGNDAGYSSLSLLPYFRAHPAFREVAGFVHDEVNQVYIFQVQPSHLRPMTARARVSHGTVEALHRDLGGERAQALLDGLSPRGYVETDSAGAPISAAAGQEAAR